MAVTQGEIDALEKVVNTGVLEVEYEGRRTRFQSGADMRARLAEMKAELAAAAAPRARFADTVYDRECS